MIEILHTKGKIKLINGDNKEISFDPNSLEVQIDGYDVSYPWEYEKSEILLEVKEYDQKLFYNFFMEEKHIVLVPYDNFELKEEILSFFWDVDILVIIGTKDAAKIFENIEAKLVVPYGEWKDVFLNTLGQHTEEVDSHKIKWELSFDSTEFVNIK